MKRLGSKLGSKFRRPARALPEASAKVPLSPHLLTHSGIPLEADSVAYEPVQRLLAVGTADGRLKLLGAYGVEKLLHTHSSEPTRQLFFLTNRGTLMRLDKQGGLEAWGVDTGQLISRLELAGDRITSACALPGEPYIMLGCWSGSLRVACLEDSLGEPTSEAREMKGMHVLEYVVPASILEASGPAVSCSVSISDEGPLLLVHHASSGALVWNIRWEKIVLRVDPTLNDLLRPYGGVSAACWANHEYESKLVATGHESGELFVWRIPDKPNGDGDCSPDMIYQTRLPPRGVSASRISALSFVSGQTNGVLAMGGQRNSEPDALIRFSIPTEEPNSDALVANDEHHSFPWCGLVVGHVLVPSNGSLEENDDPAAILMLMQGGKLMLHSFGSQDPVPLSLPFQNIGRPTTAYLTTLENDTSSFGTTRAILADKPWDGFGQCSEGADPLCKWVLSGGEPPWPIDTSHSSIYYCGHSDGVVRFWDFSSETPRGLGIACPPDKAQPAEKVSGVSVLTFADNGNFLAVGHEEGKTNLYRFSENAREIKVQVLNLANESVDISVLRVSQDPGYQLVFSAIVGACTTTALSFNSALTLLAIGDNAGTVSVIDLTIPSPKFRFLLGSSPLQSMCFGQINETDKPLGEELLFATCLDSSLAIVSTTTGKMSAPSGGWVRPKTASTSLLTVILDGAGCPIPIRTTASSDYAWLQEKNYSRTYLSSGTTVNNTGSMDQKVEHKAGNEIEAAQESSESEISEAKSAASAELLAVAVAQIDEANQDSEPREKGAESTPLSRIGSWAHGRRGRLKSKEQPKHKDTVSAGDAKQRSIPEEVEVEHDENMGKAESESDRGSPLSTGSTDKHNFVLMVTDQFARIYSIESVLQGDRTSLQKLAFSSPVIFASMVTDPMTNAVALATISKEHMLHGYSIPSLEPIEGASLDDVFGWHFDPSADGEEDSIPCLFSADSSGQLLVHGSSGEISRIGLVYGASQVQLPNTTYDWELAAAAHSARLAALQRTNSSSPEANVAGQDKLGETIKKGFGSILGVAKKARDEFDKAMHIQQQKASEDRVAPSLFTLFKVEESRKTTGVDLYYPEVDEDEALPDTHREEASAPLTTRDEVLAGAKVPEGSDGFARVRTADEIRQAYGRPRKQKDSTGKVASIMGENEKQLNERGDKIKRLDDKTSDMADDASNFASLAKQLTDQQKNRKWWQL